MEFLADEAEISVSTPFWLGRKGFWLRFKENPVNSLFVVLVFALVFTAVLQVGAEYRRIRLHLHGAFDVEIPLVSQAYAASVLRVSQYFCLLLLRGVSTMCNVASTLGCRFLLLRLAITLVGSFNPDLTEALCRQQEAGCQASSLRRPRMSIPSALVLHSPITIQPTFRPLSSSTRSMRTSLHGLYQRPTPMCTSTLLSLLRWAIWKKRLRSWRQIQTRS